MRKIARRAGFTLIEVLVTLSILAVVMPPVIGAISLATRAAGLARARNEASILAQSKLSEILIGNEWQNGSESGDFGTDWPAYHWTSNVSNWAQDTTGAGLQQIDLTVSWNEQGREATLTLSTVAYLRVQTQQ